jgi:hypothetical protein
LKKIADDGKISHAHGLAELILKMAILPKTPLKNSLDLINTFSKITVYKINIQNQ